MAMAMGSSHGNMADINITPMIDILLVLLIIFMVIAPVTSRGFEALVPHPPKALQSATPTEPVVVQVIARPGESPEYKINDTDVARTDLQPRLTGIFANRANRVMFVKAGDAVDFASVADVIDIARSANVDHVGLMTPRIVAAR